MDILHSTAINNSYRAEKHNYSESQNVLRFLERLQVPILSSQAVSSGGKSGFKLLELHGIQQLFSECIL